MVVALAAAIGMAGDGGAAPPSPMGATAASVADDRPTVALRRYRADKRRMIEHGYDVVRLLFLTPGPLDAKLPALRRRTARFGRSLDALARYRVVDEDADHQRTGLLRRGRPLVVALGDRLASPAGGGATAAARLRQLTRRGLARYLNQASFRPAPSPVRPDAGVAIRPGELTGRILFTHATPARTDVAVVGADGVGLSTVVRARPAEAGDYAGEPAPSPDGTRVAYVSDRDEGGGTTELYLADLATGAPLGRLTDGEGGVSAPSWSPDGTTIAVTKGLPGKALRTVGVDAAGGGARPLPGGGLDLLPAWSPDGRVLAVTRFFNARPLARIALLPLDGGPARELPIGGGLAVEPAWSPDGRLIAFASDRDRNGATCRSECHANREIYLVAPDGTGLRRLTRSRADDLGPSISPDGRLIAWSSDRRRPGHAFDLWVANIDGSCPRRVTAALTLPPDVPIAGGAHRDPAWVPSATPSGAPIRC